MYLRNVFRFTERWKIDYAWLSPKLRVLHVCHKTRNQAINETLATSFAVLLAQELKY